MSGMKVGQKRNILIFYISLMFQVNLNCGSYVSRRKCCYFLIMINGEINFCSMEINAAERLKGN